MPDIGTAYLQIVPSMDGVPGSIRRGLGGEADAAGVMAGGRISGKIKGALAAAGIGAALGAGLAKSIKTGANLEQAIGGIETLFKDSADEMIKNADNAFKTAGISANQYMEQATSFSASLLQSTGGDTQKAAKAADQAIIDMSDNANKMGTNIQDIQNAYQGFAKQNYTMLDNLKLGYGGTQSEMARLINDSGVLGDTMVVTAETVNQVSFDKIIEAIGVIQDEMGITGTTAREASSTIQGSLAATKSAWQNLLTGFADGNQDVGVLVSNLSESIATTVRNIVPRIGQILQGITGALPQILSSVSAELPAMLEALLPGVINGAMALVQGLAEAFPQILQTLVDGLQILIPMLVDALPVMIQSLVTGVINCLPDLIAGAIQLVAGLIAALPEILVGLIKALPEALKAVWEGIKNVFSNVGGWFKEKFTQAKEKASEAWANAKEKFGQVWGKVKEGFANVGGWFKDKFKEGMENSRKSWENAKAVFSKVWGKVKEGFANVGNWFKDRFADAKEKAVNSWSKAKENFSKVKDGIANAFSNIKDKLSQPFTKARDIIKGIADKIKGFFKGEISLPKIKMPHFGISPSGWKIGDLLKGTLPKLSIDWYAEAMQKPMIMTKPTIFGYDGSTGQLMGGGEAGSEVVSGTTTLMNMIQAAVAEQNGALINSLQNLTEMLASYFPQILAGMDRDVVLDSGAMVGALAVPMNQALGRISKRKDRGR